MLFAPPFGLLAPGRAGSKDIRTRGLNYFTGKFPESQVFFENERELCGVALNSNLSPELLDGGYGMVYDICKHLGE